MSLLKQKPGYLMFLHGSVFQYFCFAQNAFRWMFILSLSFQVYEQKIVNSDPRTAIKTMVGFSYSKVQEQNIWWNLSLINQLWGSLSWWFWILWWIHWAWVRTSSWMGHWSFSDHVSWGSSSQLIDLPACFFGRREETGELGVNPQRHAEFHTDGNPKVRTCCEVPPLLKPNVHVSIIC